MVRVLAASGLWRLIKELKQAQRGPKLIVLENVCGALSANAGKDFIQLCAALAQENYRFGGLVLDAALFVPQSRPRLFIIALAQDAPLPARLISSNAQGPFHTQAIEKSYAQLPQEFTHTLAVVELAEAMGATAFLARGD